jgi:hypothetical protein
MARSKLKDIRAALAAQLQAATGMDTRAYVPDSITPPMMALVAGSPLAKYDVVMGDVMGDIPGAGSKEYSLQVIVFLVRTNIENAQETVDDLVDGEGGAPGELSIPQAIQQDITLGGIVDFCEVTQVGTVGPIDVSGQTYFSARVHLTIGV